MAWIKVLLTNDQIKTGEEIKLQELFEELFLASGAPNEMALFSERWGSKGNLLIYFSPACLQKAEPLISIYSGTPCEKPKKKDLALLVGHADAWELLE